MPKLLSLLLLFTLTSCSLPCVNQPDDQDVERIFFLCLERIPKGPDTTVYNDWSEVVAQCRQSAYNMAKEICK